MCKSYNCHIDYYTPPSVIVSIKMLLCSADFITAALSYATVIYNSLTLLFSSRCCQTLTKINRGGVHCHYWGFMVGSETLTSYVSKCGPMQHEVSGSFTI